MTKHTFIAYHFDDDSIDGIPVAIGQNRDEVQACAIRRVLMIGAVNGGISIEQRDELNDIRADVADTIDGFFAAKFPQFA